MGDKRRVSETVNSDRKAISDCANAFSSFKNFIKLSGGNYWRRTYTRKIPKVAITDIRVSDSK